MVQIHRYLPGVIVAGMVWVTGCTAPLAERAAELSPRVLPVAMADYREAFEAAAASLVEHGFVIDRRDYRFGTITTKPRASPQVCEFWNRDNTTLDQAITSSISDQSRIVTVTLSTTLPEGLDRSTNSAMSADYYLTVRVDIERTTDPDRRLTGSTHSRNMVRNLDATPMQYQREGIHGPALVTADRDPQFERRLLEDVTRRMSVHQESASVVDDSKVKDSDGE